MTDTPTTQDTKPPQPNPEPSPAALSGVTSSSPAKAKRAGYVAYCRRRKAYLAGVHKTRAAAREAARGIADLRHVEIRPAP